jgi:hypothetical protein
MPLQFFNDVADETHDGKLADKSETAKGISRPGWRRAIDSLRRL